MRAGEQSEFSTKETAVGVRARVRVFRRESAFLAITDTFWFCILDIDECASGTAVCPYKRRCVNTFGSYYCKCHVGFELQYVRGRYDCVGKSGGAFPFAVSPPDLQALSTGIWLSIRSSSRTVSCTDQLNNTEKVTLFRFWPLGNSGEMRQVKPGQ